MCEYGFFPPVFVFFLHELLVIFQNIFRTKLPIIHERKTRETQGERLSTRSNILYVASKFHRKRLEIELGNGAILTTTGS